MRSKRTTPADWLPAGEARTASLDWQVATKNTTDAQEIAAYSSGLPADYPWIEPSADLLSAFNRKDN